MEMRDLRQFWLYIFAAYISFAGSVTASAEALYPSCAKLSQIVNRGLNKLDFVFVGKELKTIGKGCSRYTDSVFGNTIVENYYYRNVIVEIENIIRTNGSVLPEHRDVIKIIEEFPVNNCRLTTGKNRKIDVDPIFKDDEAILKEDEDDSIAIYGTRRANNYIYFIEAARSKSLSSRYRKLKNVQYDFVLGRCSRIRLEDGANTISSEQFQNGKFEDETNP